MNALEGLETSYEFEGGVGLTLPEDLERIYGRLHFPRELKGPYIIGNFVSTLDGVTSLNAPGHSTGGDISGFNLHDRIVMGLLRAIADTVVVGAGTLRSVPDHLWTADYIYPPLADAYKELRASMGKPKQPLNVIVTASGQIDLDLRVFSSEEVPVLIVTSTGGAVQIHKRKLPDSVQVFTVQNGKEFSARTILDAVIEVGRPDVVLLEGGPKLMGNFFAEKYLDELFLTLAPQVAGRDQSQSRPGFVSGKLFAPEQPLWGTLAGVKRSGNHLFLRYRFDSANTYME